MLTFDPARGSSGDAFGSRSVVKLGGTREVGVVGGRKCGRRGGRSRGRGNQKVVLDGVAKTGEAGEQRCGVRLFLSRPLQLPLGVLLAPGRQMGLARG